MDVSIIVPVRIQDNHSIDWSRRCAGLGSWRRSRLQIVGVCCGDGEIWSRMAAANQAAARNAGLAGLLHVSTTHPEEVLCRVLPACTGEVILWMGGPRYPRNAVRWLAEATSRYDFVIAQSRQSGWKKQWSRLIRFPRRVWAGPTVKQPAVQLWAALHEVMSEIQTERFAMQKLPQVIAARGFRVGQLLLPFFPISNELKAAALGPWDRASESMRDVTTEVESASPTSTTRTAPRCNDQQSRKAG